MEKVGSTLILASGAYDKNAAFSFFLVSHYFVPINIKIVFITAPINTKKMQNALMRINDILIGDKNILFHLLRQKWRTLKKNSLFVAKEA